MTLRLPSGAIALRLECDAYLRHRDLQGAIVAGRPVVVVGITCGLSATYVGAQVGRRPGATLSRQLEWALGSSNAVPILLGFSPPELARTTSVPQWGKSFSTFVNVMKEDPKSIFLCPVVGPEAVTSLVAHAKALTRR